MIILENVTKEYETHNGVARILKGVSMRVDQGEKVGILGRNGAGKSTLVRLIGGTERATSGTIVRGMSVSWPIAFAGGFQYSLTGMDNIRFICRIYGQNPREKIDFIKEFSELGKYLYEPINTYSSGMKARLAFALSMSIDFDCFLIDEVMAVGDERFNRKSNFELFENRKHKAMIIISHDMNYIRDHCKRLYVINEGVAFPFEDVDEGIGYHHHILNV